MMNITHKLVEQKIIITQHGRIALKKENIVKIFEYIEGLEGFQGIVSIKIDCKSFPEFTIHSKLPENDDRTS